jgi:Sulfotransferase family
MMTDPHTIMTRVKGGIYKASIALSAFNTHDVGNPLRHLGQKLHRAQNKLPERAVSRAPNFLVIGAGKAGTTSLWHQLSQHPQIYMHANKKLNYFAFEGEKAQFKGPLPLQSEQYSVRKWDDYLREFNGVKDELAIGEACNLYLYSPTAARRIRESIPNARMIAVLRHPAERGYSRYLQLRGSGRETITRFEDALLAEDERVAQNWWPEFHYLRVGLYHEQLQRYFETFPAEQIRIYLHSDMLEKPLAVLQEIFAFLGVREEFVPDIDVKYNPTGIPKHKGIDWLLRTLKQAKPVAQRVLTKNQVEYLLRMGISVHSQNLLKPKLSPEARQWMIHRYRDDTLRLQDVLRRDLSAWLV